MIAGRNPGCEIFTNREAVVPGGHATLRPACGDLTVEAVEAGNKNHDPKECVGFILTFSDGVRLYLSCDTSKTSRMESLAKRKLDYAFFCCDGRYNMSIAEASECAAIVGARHSIPYHMAPGALFDRELAEKFEAKGRMIISPGEEIELCPQA
jgi:L-ascorbate metabolism protein UlaG (beta-lactamase superfamily)